MILNVEKIHAIKLQWLVMVPLCDTKMHHVTLRKFLGENSFIIHTLIFALLWTFILDGPKLWHVAQSKSNMWHINYILKKIQMNIHLSK
jgi:hypothetical protein